MKISAEDLVGMLNAEAVLVIRRKETGWEIDAAGSSALSRVQFTNLLMRYAAASNGNAQEAGR